MSTEVQGLIAQSTEHYKSGEYDKSLAASSRALELAITLGDASEAHKDALLNVSVRARTCTHEQACVQAPTPVYVRAHAGVRSLARAHSLGCSWRPCMRQCGNPSRPWGCSMSCWIS